MSADFSGFDTIATHGGYEPDTTAVYGLGQGAPRGVPLYQTAPYVFKNTEHAATFLLKGAGKYLFSFDEPYEPCVGKQVCSFGIWLVCS